MTSPDTQPHLGLPGGREEVDFLKEEINLVGVGFFGLLGRHLRRHGLSFADSGQRCQQEHVKFPVNFDGSSESRV